MHLATLDVPAREENVRATRLLAVAVARQRGLSEEAVEDVRLAVGEAYLLALRPHGAVGLQIDAVGEDTVEFTVSPGPDELDEALSPARQLLSAVVPDLTHTADATVMRWRRSDEQV